MKTLADRLNHALDRANKTQAELARACNLAPASVHSWTSGKTKHLKGLSLVKAAQFLDVRELWLAEGRGVMERADSLEAPPLIRNSDWPFRGISPERYDALPQYLKGMIEGRVQSMIEEWESSARPADTPRSKDSS